MAENDDIHARHAERRRAFLQRSAVTAPAVGLLLSQTAFPAQAGTYGGGPTTTTFPVTTTLAFTTTFFSTTPFFSTPFFSTTPPV